MVAYIQFACWGVFSAMYVARLAEWRRENLEEDQEYRKEEITILAVCAAGTTAATLIMAAFFHRSFTAVKMLVLRKGGKKVSVVTYVPGRLQRHIEVPMNEISAVNYVYKKDPTRFSAFKIKKHYLTFIIDTKKGRIVRPLMMDQIIGVKR